MYSLIEMLENRTMMTVAAPVITYDADAHIVTVNCGAQGQHLIVDANQGWGLVDADTGTVLPMPVGADKESLGSSLWVINGGSGADSVEIVQPAYGAQGIIFNGDSGSDTMIVDVNPATTSNIGTTVFNGGNGNDTAIGDIDYVDLGRGS